jgi:hypothetical protein
VATSTQTTSAPGPQHHGFAAEKLRQLQAPVATKRRLGETQRIGVRGHTARGLGLVGQKARGQHHRHVQIRPRAFRHHDERGQRELDDVRCDGGGGRFDDQSLERLLVEREPADDPGKLGLDRLLACLAGAPDVADIDDDMEVHIGAGRERRRGETSRGRRGRLPRAPDAEDQRRRDDHHVGGAGCLDGPRDVGQRHSRRQRHGQPGQRSCVQPGWRQGNEKCGENRHEPPGRRRTVLQGPPSLGTRRAGARSRAIIGRRCPGCHGRS